MSKWSWVDKLKYEIMGVDSVLAGMVAHLASINDESIRNDDLPIESVRFAHDAAVSFRISLRKAQKMAEKEMASQDKIP